MWFVVILMLFLGNLMSEATAGSATIKVNTSEVIFTTHDWFLSLGMDVNLIRNKWQTFDFHSTRLETLARGLSPTYLRLSGTDADRIIFNGSENGKPFTYDTHSNLMNSGKHGDTLYYKTNNSKEECILSDVPPFPPCNFTMNASDWDKINTFAANVGWRIVFGFNAQLRQNGRWDPTNAIDLLEYSIRKGYSFNLDFELGNEPDLYPFGKGFAPVTGKQLAEDFKALRYILDGRFGSYFSDALLVGPDVANLFGERTSLAPTNDFLSDFLNNIDCDRTLHAVTWHQYYGGSELYFADNYTDPTILDRYLYPLKDAVTTVRNSPCPKLKIWQGETSTTYSPPLGPPFSESFIASFMLIDKLGLSAEMGMDVVIKQTFFGFWFALVDDNIFPTPNYWISLLFRRIVDRKVLAAEENVSQNTPRRLRYYAHCVRDLQLPDQPLDGAVVLYGMNLFSDDIQVSLAAGGTKTIQYVFTPGDDSTGLLSQHVKLNGKTLTMRSENDLPPIERLGLISEGTSGLKLPAKSVAFYIIPDAHAPACMR